MAKGIEMISDVDRLIYTLRLVADRIEKSEDVKIGDFYFTISRNELPDFSDEQNVKLVADDTAAFKIVAQGTFVKRKD